MASNLESIWKELALIMRDPTKFSYPQDDAEKFGALLRKSFEGDEKKAKDLLEVLKMIDSGKTMLEIQHELNK